VPDTVKLIVYIAVFAIVLYAAYYFTKLMASFSGGFSKSKHLKVADKLVLSKDKSLIIVKAGQKDLLLCVTSSSVQKICELDGADLIDLGDGENAQTLPSFDHLFTKIKKAHRGEK